METREIDEWQSGFDKGFEIGSSKQRRIDINRAVEYISDYIREGNNMSLENYCEFLCGLRIFMERN